MAKITQDGVETVYTMIQPTQHEQQSPKTTHDQAIEDLIGALNDTTDSANLSVYRQIGTGKEAMSLVGSWSPDHFKSVEDLLLWLRDNYGGGSYRFQVRVRGKLLANKLHHVEAPVSQKSSAQSNNDGILGVLMAAQEKLLERLVNTKPVIENSEEKFLEKMLMYKQLFSQNAPSAVVSGFGQLKETIEVMKEFGANFGGNEDKEEGFSDILKNSIPLLTAAITANNGNNVQRQQAPVYQPNPIQPRVEPQMDLMTIQYKMGINLLLSAAKSNKEPATYARMVDDQYGERALEVVGNTDEFLKQMAVYEPDVLNYRRWFDDLAEHIKAINGHDSKFSAEYDDDPIEPKENVTIPIDGD